jgi:hypothetical protein
MQERLFSSRFIILLAQVPDCLLVAEEPKKKHKRHPIHKALGGRSMAGFSSASQPPVPQVSTEPSSQPEYPYPDPQRKNSTDYADCPYRKSTHRVATAVFWRTFHHDGKISPGW